MRRTGSPTTRPGSAKSSLRDGTLEAARLAEDRDAPPAPAPYPPPRGDKGLPTIDEIQLPDQERFRDCAWFIGIDPAARRDNFGVVVYGLFPKPEASADAAWSPFLRDAFDIDHPNMTDTFSWVQNVLFRIYPPRACIIDATKDTPVAEELARKYGRDKVHTPHGHKPKEL